MKLKSMAQVWIFQSHFRRGNKIITGGRGREGPGWERGEEGKRGGRIRYGERQERSSEGQENEWEYSAEWS
jgi:hypothetical protein